LVEILLGARLEEHTANGFGSEPELSLGGELRIFGLVILSVLAGIRSWAILTVCGPRCVDSGEDLVGSLNLLPSAMDSVEGFPYCF
jgi:hypothetical protein